MYNKLFNKRDNIWHDLQCIDWRHANANNNLSNTSTASWTLFLYKRFLLFQ